MMVDFCTQIGESELSRDMDFRKPEYRREVFLKFYEFHLKYRAHPGCVYQFIPFLAEHFQWGTEERLWYASINGLTQHPMTSLAIYERIPPPPFTNEQFYNFKEWFNDNWYALPYDDDRKYQKRLTPEAINRFNEKVGEYGSLKNLYTGDFNTLWERARRELYTLGRLGAWSGLEFVKIAGIGNINFEFNTLFLKDKNGSKSHRNGLCILLGRGDLDWHEKLNPTFDGNYTREQYEWLEAEGALLLQQARERFAGRDFAGDVGYETLESALCTYKSWHRPNRRYPGVYLDMAYARLLDTATKNPKLDLSPFWEAREKYLPPELRVECNPRHPQYGKKRLSQWHQNLYIKTGKIPNMELEFNCFKL